jgi:hypothetical protein
MIIGLARKTKDVVPPFESNHRMIAKDGFYQYIGVSWVTYSYICTKDVGKELQEESDMYRIGSVCKSVPKIMEAYLHGYIGSLNIYNGVSAGCPVVDRRAL